MHGALCVAYSGQCLTSEALGGRSANRGECAQACRMPYEIVCDGELVDLGKDQYLLSPQDLAAYDLVPRLIELGVVQPEDRGPPQVARVRGQHHPPLSPGHRRTPGRAGRWRSRHATSRRCSSRSPAGSATASLTATTTRCWCAEITPRSAGSSLGRVESVTPRGVRLDLLRRSSRATASSSTAMTEAGVPEQGGRVYEVARRPRPRSRGRAALRPRAPVRPATRLQPGQGVWKTDDPELTAPAAPIVRGTAARLVDLDLDVRAEAGMPLDVEGRHSDRASSLRRESDAPARPGPTLPAGRRALLRDQLGRLGGTIYRLRDLTAVDRRAARWSPRAC